MRNSEPLARRFASDLDDDPRQGEGAQIIDLATRNVLPSVASKKGRSDALGLAAGVALVAMLGAVTLWSLDSSRQEQAAIARCAPAPGPCCSSAGDHARACRHAVCGPSSRACRSRSAGSAVRAATGSACAGAGCQPALQPDHRVRRQCAAPSLDPALPLPARLPRPATATRISPTALAVSAAARRPRARWSIPRPP